MPMLVRWPGKLPAGTVSPQVGNTMDLTASILAATNTPIPANARLEGTDLFPALAGKVPQIERTLFWRSMQGRTQRAVRSGDWKLVVDGSNMMLFDVRNDIGERKNLTNRRADVVARLRPMIAAWERDVDDEAKANGTAAIHGRLPGGGTAPAQPAGGQGSPGAAPTGAQRRP